VRAGIQRGLFWQVYLTLLASLLLAAILGAGLWHWISERPSSASIGSAGIGGAVMGARAHVHDLAILLTVAAVVGCAAYPVMSRITRRLEALRSSVEAWGGGALARRAPIDGRDEIAAVAASFNAAADRVEALLTAHKSLLAHASHELRSPLARLALATEMFATAPRGDLLPAIRCEIAELDGLVEEILLASRLDSGQDIDRRECVDCLALAAEEAARAGVDVGAVEASSAPFEVEGSARLLRRMIRNLIENAVKHGEPPVEVRLGIEGSGPASRITISVVDHGPEIRPELRERVFEPFFRPGDRAEAGGSWGLGLSLVRQIAARHGGAVSCVSESPDVTAFAVELPSWRSDRAG